MKQNTNNSNLPEYVVSKTGRKIKVTCNQCGFCPTAKPGTKRYVYKH